MVDETESDPQPDAFDWDLLRVFLTAVQSGSYTRAATSLAMNRTTVGRKINLLEEKLNLKLFELTDEGYQPTEAGLRLVQQASTIKSEINQLFGDLYSINDSLRGALCVGYQEGFAEIVLPAARRLIYENPSLQITCNESHSPLTDLRSRKCDVAIAVAQRLPTFLEGDKLADIERRPYSFKDDSPSLEDVEKWVANTNDPDLFKVERWERKNLNPSVTTHRFNSTEATSKAITAGFGQGFLWTCLAPKSLFKIDAAQECRELDSSLFLARIAKIPMTKRVSAFWDIACSDIPKMIV